MKNIILIVLLLLTTNCYATKPNKHHNNQYDTLLEFLATLETNSNADSTANAKAEANSRAEASADNNNDIGIGDQIASLQVKYDAAAASASNLNLAYCSDGNAAQAIKGGFSVGQVNFICESVMAIEVALSRAPVEIEQAKECHDSKDPNLKIQSALHIARAHKAFSDAEDIQLLINEYIKDRSKTAKYGAWGRDLSFPLTLLGLLIYLL